MFWEGRTGVGRDGPRETVEDVGTTSVVDRTRGTSRGLRGTYKWVYTKADPIGERILREGAGSGGLESPSDRVGSPGPSGLGFNRKICNDYIVKG